jgi:hypothetical protein
LDNNDVDQSSITPKRPLLSRDRDTSTLIEVSPLSDRNSRRFQTVRVQQSTTPVIIDNHEDLSSSTVETCTFVISPPQQNRTTIIDDDDCTYVPAYIQKKAKPAPTTTWKTSFPLKKSSTLSKVNVETVTTLPDVPSSQLNISNMK